MFAQRLHESGNRTGFLANGNINTIYWITIVKILFLVDNGINSNGRFTRLTVTNDQLSLATTNRNHTINGLQTGLQRLLYRLTEDYTRCFSVQRHFESTG